MMTETMISHGHQRMVYSKCSKLGGMRTDSMAPDIDMYSPYQTQSSTISQSKAKCSKK